MGRSLLLDPSIEAKLGDEELSHHTGLVVGSVVDDKYYGVFLAETPEEENEEMPAENEKEKLAKSLDVDVGWMVEHFKQASRLLPGGLTVLGFYFLNNPGVIEKQDGKLRKLLSSVSNLDPSVPNEMILMQDLNTTKILDSKSSTFKSIDVKVSSKAIDFVIAETKIILDIPVAVSENNNDLSKDTALGLSKFLKLLNTSIFIIDNKLLSEKEILGKPVESDKKKKSKLTKKVSLDPSEEESQEQEKVAVELLFEETEIPEDSSVSEDTKVRMKFAGRLSSRTFLPPGATVQWAKVSVLRDLERSLRTRMEMHTNSLADEEASEEDKPDKIVHELPRRVFVTVEDTGVCVSDYLFPGEGLEECANNIKEIFGWSVEQDCIEDDVELVASPREVRPGIVKKLEAGGAAKRLPKGVVLSLGMALLSAGLAWMTLGSAEPEL